MDALKSLAERISPSDATSITVYYLEVFGGKVTAASKQYTTEMHTAYRLFDVVRIRDYTSLLAMSPQEIAGWRDHGGQSFVSEEELNTVGAKETIPLTPRLFTLIAEALPHTLEEMYDFLKEQLPETHSKLDAEAEGRPEGIVLRTTDRSVIAKARFEDYERTFKRRRK